MIDSMNNLSTLKTILKTLIGASVATSLIALPVRANEDNLVDKITNAELILSQNFSDSAPQSGSLRDRPIYPEPSDNFKNIVGIIGLAIGTGVIGYHVTRAYKPSLVNSLATINENKSSSILDRVSPKLSRELLRLVHNRQTASRLLSGTLTSHPGRSPNWLAEKVIYDLKRDR